MKICFLEHSRPRSALHFNDVANTPLSSCLITGYIASLMQSRGYPLEIIDTYTCRDSISRMVEKTIEKNYDLLAIHLVYSWEHTPRIVKAIEKIREQHKAPIVVYGFYPTFAYESLMRSCEAIDYVILGEPEHTFLELCEKIRRGENDEKVEGLVLRKGHELLVTPRREVIGDLDQLPFPLRLTTSADTGGRNILGSRGCYGACTFCSINTFYGNGPQWRGRSPENIYKEAELLLSRYTDKYLYFVDANFFGPGNEGQLRAATIAERLSNIEGLTFGLECRVNDVKEPTIRMLVEAGLREVFLGVESGSPRGLARMRKGTTVEQNIRAIGTLRRYGIEPYCGFIMYEPDTTLAEVRDNFNFLKSHKLLKRLHATLDLLYHPQIVLMGTESYDVLRQGGRLILSSYNLYQGNWIGKDERVVFLAEVTGALCRHLLARMDDSTHPLHWKNHNDLALGVTSPLVDKINQWLLDYYEELICKLEAGAMVCNQVTMERTIQDSITTVENLIRREDDASLQKQQQP